LVCEIPRNVEAVQKLVSKVACKILKCILEKAYFSLSKPLMTIIMRTQREERHRQSLHLLKEYFSHPKQSIAIHMDDKGHSH
jgi:hypothetical protein